MELPADLEAAAADIVLAVERGRLTRGKGGEVLRPAICRLVQTTAAAGLALRDEQRECLLGQLRDNLRHATPEVQAAAAAALAAFAARYLPHASPAAQQQLVQHFAAALGDVGNVAARRGGALALGALPRFLLEPRQAEVLAALAAASVPEEAAEARDAETRVNAAKALAQVALTLLGQGAAAAPGSANTGGPDGADASSGSGGSGSGVCLPAEALQQACDAVVAPLLAALDDYSIDNR